MEDKKQDVNSLEELLKVVNAYSGWFANLADELSKVLADIKVPKKEEDTWEMKCLYNTGDNYWIICDSGDFEKVIWNDHNLDKEVFSAGNAFPTKEAAELEAKRRNLLTRFRAFRDECNGDWKVDLQRSDNKFYISYSDNMEGLCVYSFGSIEGFNLFGCFKSKEDAERAIELFGDEIKELFVEGDA
ncbi:hypothetical protein [uncultured Granulicatella sp.]|uniref:hypothetical protein n=1 Tax=uncultured Granulicatella sp. TaxID=316089 RepID=UPI00260998CE|nr:hypothetical protein [uncultured Granulicatella sp.]